MKSVRASIPAMPKLLRSTLLALVLAGAAALAGCGGNGDPDPSISGAEARTLLGQIEEIQANVDVESLCVAADRTDNLIADVQELPSSVNSDVRQALENGANNLKLLLSGECENRTETTTTTETMEPTTTEETTTVETEPTTTERTQTQETTTTQTQTQPNITTTPGASGGIGPGGQ
jgi:hypothetical protein